MIKALLISIAFFSLTACAEKNADIFNNVPVINLPACQDLAKCAIDQGVSAKAAYAAFAAYAKFKDQVTNTDYITIVDFTKPSGKVRFYMVNTKDGHVDALLVAHGLGSDRNNTGLPKKFSNVHGSLMSSLGAYIVSEVTPSVRHGKVIRLDGLEKSNNLARDRDILIHSATYVSEDLDKMGMSWGCFAIPVPWIKTVLKRLPGGSFLYAYGGNRSELFSAEDQFASYHGGQFSAESI